MIWIHSYKNKTYQLTQEERENMNSLIAIKAVEFIIENIPTRQVRELVASLVISSKFKE